MRFDPAVQTMPPQAGTPSAFLDASFTSMLQRVVAASTTSLLCPQELWPLLSMPFILLYQ